MTSNQYNYNGYIGDFSNVNVKIVSPIQYKNLKTNPINSGDDLNLKIENFLTEINSSPSSDDLMGQKVEIVEDKVDLIMYQLQERQLTKNSNLEMLYNDLVAIENWRHDRGYPHCYSRDKTWQDLNKMELDIRNQIRREQKDFNHAVGKIQTDLRESLLELKIKSQKAKLFDDTESEDQNGTTSNYTFPENGVYAEIEPAGSYQKKGDTNYRTNQEKMAFAYFNQRIP